MRFKGGDLPSWYDVTRKEKKKQGDRQEWADWLSGGAMSALKSRPEIVRHHFFSMPELNRTKNTKSKKLATKI